MIVNKDNAILNIFKQYNSKNKNIDALLGNILISGATNVGQKKLINEFIQYGLISNKNIIIVTNEKKYLNNIDRKLYSIDFNNLANSDRFNLFKNLNHVEAKDLILDIISQYKELKDTEALRIERYILSIMKVMKSINEPVKFNNLIQYDIDKLSSMVENSTMSEGEKQRILRFVNEMFKDFIIIESYFEIINENGLGDVLSGELGIDDMIDTNTTLLLTLDQFSKKSSSNVMLKIILKLLLKDIPRENNYGSLLIFDGVTFENIDDLIGLLKLTTNESLNCVLTIEDIATTIKNCSNRFVDYCKSFMIFTQSSNENCGYWSEFFGTYETMEASYSYIEKKPKTIFGKILGNSGTVVGKRDYEINGMNTNKVTKSLYKPEVFRALNEKEMIYYIKELKRSKKISL